MNVLIVTSGLHVIGGAQVFIFRLYAGLLKSGYNVKILTIDLLTSHQKRFIEEQIEGSFFCIKTNFLFQFIEKVGFKLGLKNIMYPLQKMLFKKTFIQAKKSFSGQIIVNTHLIAADIFLSNLELSNCKIISCPHGEFNIPYLVDVGYEITDVIEKLSSKLDGIIYLHEAKSSIIPNLLERNPAILTAKIYNGLDRKNYAKINQFKKDNEVNNEDFIFLMVARGEESKGWLQTIHAFLKISKASERNIQLILVGDSPYLRDLKTNFESEKIVFVGYTDPRQYYEIASCFVFPTYFQGEALPNVIVEAMAYNLPIISSNNAEIPLMLESANGPCGVCLDIESKTGTVSVEELTKVMLEFYTDQNQYTYYKANCHGAFRKFEMDFCLKSYINFFKKVHVRN